MGTPTTGSVSDSTFCASGQGTFGTKSYDNDDANFTAVAPLNYDTWGLSVADGASATRTQNVTAFAHWSKALNYSEVWHNGTGIDTKYALNPAHNNFWTNYTLYLANGTEFVQAGRVNVSGINVQDFYQQWNWALPQKSFILWSTANITNITLSNNVIYNGSSTVISCRVADSYSGATLSGYTVSFFNSTSQIGSSATNSSGWAFATYFDSTQSPPRTETLKCNATDMPSMYYNSPAVPELSTPLQVTDLRANLAPVPDASFGASATIRANITGNASAITQVTANLGFYNYTLNGYSTSQVTLSPSATYSATNTEYSANYSAKFSGLHNVSLSAMAGRTAGNSTAFNVSFGSPSLSFVFPNFRVLSNQTFNFTVNVTATSGDIINPSLFLNFTNQSMMNVSDGQFTKSLAINLTNGSARSYIWNVTASGIGLLRANVTATLAKGSNASSDAPFSALAPIVSVISSSINITQNGTLVVKIVGNTSAIQSANFTVGKPYGGGAGTVAGIFFGTDTESNCVGLGGGVGNVANGANTSCSGGIDCNLAVDNSTLTQWTEYAAGRWLSVNLSQRYTVDTLEIVWAGGATNTSLFYRSSGSAVDSSSSGWRPVQEFQYQSAPAAKNTTTIKSAVPFDADTLLLNDSTSAGLSIYEVRIYPVEGRVDQCYIYRANTSVNSSGTHTISSGVRTGSSMSPVFSNTSFFVSFGTPVITPPLDAYYVVGGHPFEYKILASGGDLRDINATLSIFNKTFVNFTAGVNASQNISFIGYNTQSSALWQLSALSPGTTNLSLFANSSSGLGGTGYNDFNVTIILQDYTPPVIYWFSLSGNSTNLRNSVTVTVNASDNYLVKNVTAKLIAPDASSFNQTNSTDSKMSGLWTITLDPSLINQTGNYSVKVYAVDLNESNLVSNATLLNFTAYSTYSVLPDTSYSLYNRGENITFRIYDVANNTVSGAYWSVNETGAGQNATTIYGGTNDTYFYYFAGNKTPGVYNVTIYVNKSGNSGNYSGNISASSSLYITFVQPPGETTYSAGQSISSPRAKIYVKNVHNTSLANLTNVYMACPGNPSPLALIYEYDSFYGGNTYTTQPDNPCKVPSSQGADFYLTANATDQYNNTGVQNSPPLHTSAGSSSSQQPSSGGGGGGGGGVEKIIVNETSNATPYMPPKIHNFNVSLDSQEIEIMQGKEATIIASIANTGDFEEGVGARNSETILSLAYSRAMTLAKSADIDVPIKVRANLSIPAGDYFITIYFSSRGIEKSRAVKVRVTENPDLPAIAGIVSGIADIKEKMQEYGALGINISLVQEKVSSAEANLARAEEASVFGDAALLAEAVEAARKDAESASAEIARYKVEKFLLENKYGLAAAGASSLAFIYFMSVFLVPYITITRRIYTLSRQESILAGARKATEMQYFVRRIDDATFHKIMTDEQDKIYKIRSEVKRLEEELALLKKLKFSELERLKNEWQVKMKEAEKARHMASLREGAPGRDTAGAFTPKKENIFMRLAQILRGFFRKKPAYSI